MSLAHISNIIHGPPNEPDLHPSILIVVAYRSWLFLFSTFDEHRIGVCSRAVTKDDIDEIKPSKVSQMPEKLLDSMNA
jgi:hypothetical protein